MSVSYQNINLFFGGRNNDLSTFIFLTKGDAMMLDYNTSLSNQNSFINNISFQYTFSNRSLLLHWIWPSKGEPQSSAIGWVKFFLKVFFYFAGQFYYVFSHSQQLLFYEYPLKNVIWLFKNGIFSQNDIFFYFSNHTDLISWITTYFSIYLIVWITFLI